MSNGMLIKQVKIQYITAKIEMSEIFYPNTIAFAHHQAIVFIGRRYLNKSIPIVASNSCYIYLARNQPNSPLFNE